MFGLTAENCVFIDDTHMNIEAALFYGMKGIVYQDDPEDLVEKLRALGVRV